jgi:NDP-sugar pyrophosphorylase family protein
MNSSIQNSTFNIQHSVRGAVILAAGRGTRMGTLTADTPKPLLTVRGRALIEHVLTGLAAAGIERAVVVTGYRGEQIEAALGDGAALGLSLTYVRQERAEGTARALLLTRHLVAPQLVGGAAFALSWGDVLVPRVFYRDLLAASAASGADVQLAVNEIDDPWQGAAVYVDADWRVTQLVEKPARGTATTRWNNAGIFVFRPSIFDYASALAPSARGEYELPQAIARMIEDGRDIRALPVRGFWSDVGTPADLARAEQCFDGG